jgi:predicted molibdopterin-dependent oxidoreductase YjgC
MLIVGANVMEQLPHVGSRIQDAVENGCKVVAVDPRVSRLAPQATVFLNPKPGTDLAWLRVMAKSILDRQLYAEGVPEMPGFEELRTSLDGVNAGRLEAECGLSAEAIAEAADMLASNPPCIVMFGLGVMQQAESTRTIKALADIALLLGGEVMPLRGQNNAQGACDMGLLPDMLPGYAALSDTAARVKWEKQWGHGLPEEPGMDAARMLRGCATGETEALLIFGENVALSAPDTQETLAALGKAKFVAVADMYLTETAQLADVVFPACSFVEKDGTFTNIERRVQRVRRLLDPPGESISDLAIIAALASVLGSNLSSSPAEVMGEIASKVPAYSRVSYEALDETWGSPWVCEDAVPRLAPMPAPEPAGVSDLPMRLIAGRINFHQQTGTMAWRSPILAREYPNCFAEMNEADAEALKLRPGSMVTISTPTGSLTRRLLLSDTIPKGCVHVPHFTGGDSPNALVSYQPDPISGVPAYKACAVKVEAAG